jgi:hypothetical protein
VWNISCGRQQQANIQYSSVWNLCRINFNRHYLFWLTTWDDSLSVRFSTKKKYGIETCQKITRQGGVLSQFCIGFVPLDFLFLILCIGCIYRIRIFFYSAYCCFCVVKLNHDQLLLGFYPIFLSSLTFPVFYRHGSNNFCWKHLIAGSISFILCCHSTSATPFT